MNSKTRVKIANGVAIENYEFFQSLRHNKPLTLYALPTPFFSKFLGVDSQTLDFSITTEIHEQAQLSTSLKALEDVAEKGAIISAIVTNEIAFNLSPTQDFLIILPAEYLAKFKERLVFVVTKMLNIDSLQALQEWFDMMQKHTFETYSIKQRLGNFTENRRLFIANTGYHIQGDLVFYNRGDNPDFAAGLVFKIYSGDAIPTPNTACYNVTLMLSLEDVWELVAGE